MTTYHDAHALASRLYVDGILSHDQATPLLAALGDALAMDGDYHHLCVFYAACQELRYLMRAVTEARAGQHDEAVSRANRQWQVVREMLERLALDDAHPGRALNAVQEGV